jgi:hypothetical protein
VVLGDMVLQREDRCQRIPGSAMFSLRTCILEIYLVPPFHHLRLRLDPLKD